MPGRIEREGGEQSMARCTYTTPLLVGMLALGGCPDDLPADTEGTSTGDTTDLTSVGPTPTTTTVDPDSATTDDSSGDVCEPACGAGQCCVGGSCSDQPEPSCPGGCAELEACLCPAGSDPCDCEASCVLCGVEGGSYDSCLDVECPAGSSCVLDDPAAPTFGWCAQQGCGADDCACPLPAAGATARPACGVFDGDDGFGSCYLDCGADDAVCPEGMLCRTLGGQEACVWPGEGIVSSCCFENGGLGCDDPTCQTTVCDEDVYCCEKEWDEVCVGQAQDLCGGLCPIENPQPQYGDCINVGDCDVGLVCLGDMAMTFGWCGTLDCRDDRECQPPPATGDAPAVCAPINAMGTLACVLDCTMGQTCPDGMACYMDFVCVWEEELPPPPMLPGYGDCADNPLSTCQPGEDACLTDAGGTAAGCSQSGCAAAMECPVAPPTGDAPVACADLGTGSTCYLDCAGGQTCPDGTVCTDMGGGNSACLWADDDFLLDEDFELGAFRPGWSLIDVDGNVPAAQVSYVNDAWVVTDVIEADVNFAAYSTSYYSPSGTADDWLITPRITLGPASDLSWEAWATDVDFPDGYEVRISTGMPTVVDFMANPALFTIDDEAQAFTLHTVDLAAAGYMNVDVYIAWHNDSNDEFILLVDNVQVTE